VSGSEAGRVRIFVAMPGTAMGEGARWDDVDEIKRHLFVPIQQRLAEALHQPVDLVIEKDKIDQGVIHRSMFAEAYRTSVYIADLTGANPNVYLELGVRWALRDHVTVLICQDLNRDVRFNVSASRVIRYGSGPGELDDARRQIVGAILTGLTNRHVDSPVQQVLATITVGRAEWDALNRELADLRRERGDSLVDSAELASHADRIDLLRSAVGQYPAHARAHLQLGKALRADGRYSEATVHFRHVNRLRPEWAEGWRELGVALSKGGDLRGAINALETARRLGPDDDPELLSNLGGAYRRRARREAPEGQPFDWDLLEEARWAYLAASRLSANDTYPRVNLAVIDLLLARGDPDDLRAALERLRELEGLARFVVADSKRQDPWKLFDLAHVLVLTGRPDEAIVHARLALDVVPTSERPAMLDSVLAPLQDIVRATLPADVAPAVARLVEDLNSSSH
jgi:Flp pilus assembly protein TadD